MATRMSLWRLNDDGSAAAIAEKALDTEEQIESAVESAPELLGIDVLIIGRQTQTPSGPLDLLALDGDARLVVIEKQAEQDATRSTRADHRLCSLGRRSDLRQSGGDLREASGIAGRRGVRPPSGLRGSLR